MLTVSCRVTTRIPSATAPCSAQLRSRALAAQPRCDAQTGRKRQVEEARAVRRERPPAVVQQPAPPVAARSVRPPALTPELAAATAEFRRALVEHLGWTNQAAQAAAEEAAHSRNRNFYKYAGEVPSAAVVRGWAGWLSELGLARHDICRLTTAAADSRWWWVPHDRAPPQPLKGLLPQACALDIAEALAERYPTLLPKTAALLYLCHFNCLVAGDCDDSLGMLAGLAAEGVPPHLLHRLALQMAGFGSASPGSKYAAQVAASAARSSRPAASPAQVRCTIAELREACGGSWSDAVSGFIAGWSAAELKAHLSSNANRSNILSADGLAVWEIV